MTLKIEIRSVKLLKAEIFSVHVCTGKMISHNLSLLCFYKNIELKSFFGVCCVCLCGVMVGTHPFMLLWRPEVMLGVFFFVFHCLCSAGSVTEPRALRFICTGL